MRAKALIFLFLFLEAVGGLAGGTFSGFAAAFLGLTAFLALEHCHYEPPFWVLSFGFWVPKNEAPFGKLRAGNERSAKII
jgi:hypothetical protein